MATALKGRQLYIDGKWVDGSTDDELEVINPATEEVITTVPQASIDDVERAIAAARRAFEEGPWPRMSPRERSDALVRFVQAIGDRRIELVEMIIAEAGAARPIAQAVQLRGPLQVSLWVAGRAGAFPYEGPLPPPVGP